jgi:rhodanese-related sulfurtransferase
MIPFLKNILNGGSEVDLKELVLKGAQIIDVRSKEEFQAGHIPNSVNIPLQNLTHNLSKIKKGKPVITCCASGIRSASAKTILKSSDFIEVYDGGGWMNLKDKIS